MQEYTEAVRAAQLESGRQLKVARIKLGLTQDELAAKLGTTQILVSRCERGDTHLKQQIVYAVGPRDEFVQMKTFLEIPD